MTWIKVDDAFWRHRKLAALDPNKALAAVGLWVLGLSWIGEHLTDGHITDRALTQAAGSDGDSLADELVRVGLWERVPGGYVYHDYLEYNPSQNEVLTLRATHKAAAQVAGEARAKGASRSARGRFTSVDAGNGAGDLSSDSTSVPTSPVSRLPSPRAPLPRSPEPFNASADADAISALFATRDLEDQRERRRRAVQPVKTA
jgi:hypothetical protein